MDFSEGDHDQHVQNGSKNLWQMTGVGHGQCFAIDSTRYPGWKDVKWSYADLKPGDCFLAD